MRLCIPTKTGEGSTAPVHEHFGSAAFFTVYDTDTKNLEVIANNDRHHAHGTCHPMTMLASKNIDAVICAGMGARAVERINAAGIKAYRSTSRTVADIAGHFQQGALTEITPADACDRHGCH